MAPVVALSPEEGLHEYVLAPLAVMEMFPPVQYDGDTGLVIITGKALTVTVIVLLWEQLSPSTPVTVYVVVVVGLAVTVAPVVAFKPVEGLHE